MLWDVIGCKVTSIGGPSGAAEKQTQKNTLRSIRERTASLGKNAALRELCHSQLHSRRQRPAACGCPCPPAPTPVPQARSGTCFLRADGELLARLTAPDLVEGVHADAVHRGWVEVHNVRLVDGGRDVACRLLKIPGIWKSGGERQDSQHLYPVPGPAVPRGPCSGR